MTSFWTQGDTPLTAPYRTRRTPACIVLKAPLRVAVDDGRMQYIATAEHARCVDGWWTGRRVGDDGQSYTVRYKPEHVVGYLQ